MHCIFINNYSENSSPTQVETWFTERAKHSQDKIKNFFSLNSQNNLLKFILSTKIVTDMPFICKSQIVLRGKNEIQIYSALKCGSLLIPMRLHLPGLANS